MTQPLEDAPKSRLIVTTATARAGSYYRRTRYIMFVLLLGYGAWSIYDGFYSWPKKNQDYYDKEAAAAIARGEDPAKAVNMEKAPHPGLDIPFNRAVGIAMPPLALLMLVMVLRKSRGEIRMDNEMLHAPGHPPVPFSAITALDARQWDRKGIAYVDYELSGAKGRILLDDFVYEREPIDAIYDAISRYLQEDAGDESAA